ncbi:hypothetical protein MNBD_GAMMA12-914 [hydrothermal vent metagenome]|uniref:Small-conductance mechanosensitive channel n=1 Tax=hydrothermal vent metagenome TaxID=652676 RepID=A0A3B0Y790_9ZZZZ
MTDWTDIFTRIDTLDYFVFSLNILIFIFSRIIVESLPSRSNNSISKRLWSLRIINLFLFASFFLVVLLSPYIKFVDFSILKKLSGTGITLLVSFLLVHFIQIMLVRRYGRSREIEGTEYHTQTYQSEGYGLLVFIIAVIMVFLIILNIWNMTDWLKATSVLGGLLLVLFATKDVWVPDNINGLMLLYNGNIEPGSLIQIKELDILAIVMQISLTQTVLRDLVQRNQIVIPNTRLRRAKVEVLTKATSSGLIQYAEFNIAYGYEVAEVEAMLLSVWTKACEECNAINIEKEPKIRVFNNSDHAVSWHLFYYVSNVYRLSDAQYGIQKAAYEVSLETGITLQTPTTHQVEMIQP